jgi:hypothetical protein
MTCQKYMLLNCQELVDSMGAGWREEKGGPKNEGISNDVYENKGQKIFPLECLTICMKTKKLRGLSSDIDENKGG